MINCKGLCEEYKARRGHNYKSRTYYRYENGQHYCATCCVYLETQDMKCICCHGKLRSVGRNSLVKNTVRLRKWVAENSPTPIPNRRGEWKRMGRPPLYL